MIGLIGGIGPASTLDYYVGILKGYMDKTGTDHYPEIFIHSIDMTELISFIEQDRWDKVVSKLVDSIKMLSDAGAEFAAIASNTPHLVFDEIAQRSPVPLISIVEETCKYIRKVGHKRVLTIGTRFTMRSGLYTKPLTECGVTSLLPYADDQERIYALFFPNLENGIVVPEDKEQMLALVSRIIREQVADSLLLGCTELPLMIKPEDVSVPTIDTMQIHIESIVNYMTRLDGKKQLKKGIYISDV